MLPTWIEYHQWWLFIEIKTSNIVDYQLNLRKSSALMIGSVIELESIIHR